MTIQEQIAAMQTERKPRGDVWQNNNGTWAHRHDASGEFADKAGAQADFRFSQDWYRGRS